MGKRSTRFKIAFFGLLLTGFVVIQYCWVQLLKKEKLQEFRTQVIRGVEGATLSIPLHELTENAVSKALHSKLGDIPVEFSVTVNGNKLASPGFAHIDLSNSHNLVFYYLLSPEENGKFSPEQVITVVVPERIAYIGISWIIAASLCLTLMMLAIFIYVIILIGRKQQLLYENRTNVIKDMMQQLETPLSTVSVAVEALRTARVMNDAGKMNYYQQVINEENQRMNEQVNKMLQDLR